MTVYYFDLNSWLDFVWVSCWLRNPTYSFRIWSFSSIVRIFCKPIFQTFGTNLRTTVFVFSC